MSNTIDSVFTVGHSTHGAETFVALLQQHNVTAIADVRSMPYSKLNPHFNRRFLEQRLTEKGIKYVFLGLELGARSSDPSCYENGRVQYSRLARTSLFRDGIGRIVQGARDYRVALMCAEKEPLECHRTLLVAHALSAMGVPINHIHADGRLESHTAAMDRLITIVKLPHSDLFRSREELVAEAVSLQEQRVAYVKESPVAQSRSDAL
jgi:uncharacterized protein (DUF488 family)